MKLDRKAETHTETEVYEYTTETVEVDGVEFTELLSNSTKPVNVQLWWNEYKTELYITHQDNLFLKICAVNITSVENLYKEDLDES